MNARGSLLLFLQLLITAEAAEKKQPSVVKNFSLKVTSYNIKGLPGLFTSSEYKNPRYSIIGKILSEESTSQLKSKIVLIQEGFSEHTKTLIETAKFPFVSQGPNHKSFVGLDSGLYILSDYPVIAKAKRQFKQHPYCSGWDCFANKGVQFARLEIPVLPHPLEIFNTHLQAGRDEPPSRKFQVQVLIDFFKKHHTPGNPVIFGGDFNLRPTRSKPVYDEFVAGTLLSNAGKWCLERNCSHSPDTGWQGIFENAVDHQFYSTDGAIRITPLSIKRDHGLPVDGFKLSDHLTHEVEYQLSWDPNKIPTHTNGSALIAQ